LDIPAALKVVTPILGAERWKALAIQGMAQRASKFTWIFIVI